MNGSLPVKAITSELLHKRHRISLHQIGYLHISFFILCTGLSDIFTDIFGIYSKFDKRKTLIKRYFNTFLFLSKKDKCLFFEALFFLYLAKTMLVVFPFRLCLKFVKTRDYRKTPDVMQLTNIRYAIGRANRLAFWKNVCLVQSFAARWMLRRRKINSELFIGVNHSDQMGKIKAHAWIISNGEEIVRQGKNYVVLFKI
jgi:Transglutaminase-like superfamily